MLLSLVQIIPSANMTTDARNKIPGHAESESKENEVFSGLLRMIIKVGSFMWGSEIQDASSLKVSRVLALAACLPIWLCVPTLKAAK